MIAWEPDWALTEAVLDGRRTIRDLDTRETAWVVAELTCRGYTAAAIGARLSCTPRHVKRLRAAPLTQVMAGYWEQLRHLQMLRDVVPS